MAAAKKLIGVVEDDEEVGQLIARTLRSFDFDVVLVRYGGDLLQMVKERHPAACIVDLGLPDVDGLQLIRRLEDSGIGILAVTGRGDVADRIVGLEFGADDYLVKPFEPRELVARLNSVLRRLSKTPDAHAVAAFAGWKFDVDAVALTSPAGKRSCSAAPRRSSSSSSSARPTACSAATICSRLAAPPKTPSIAASTCASRACGRSSATSRRSRASFAPSTDGLPLRQPGRMEQGMNEPPPGRPGEMGLERNPANHVPLSPVTFIERAASVFPERTAVVQGAVRRPWARDLPALPAAGLGVDPGGRGARRHPSR
jgi:CheY-like chemotaxis protein